jgi:hypothetical protein
MATKTKPKAKAKTKTKPAKKVKASSTKKAKATRKAKKTVSKKAKSPAKKKISNVKSTKNKKSAAKQKKSNSKAETKTGSKKLKKAAIKKTKSHLDQTKEAETILNGAAENEKNESDLHLTPETEKKSPVVDSHKAEPKMHNLEEVAFHMENQKVKAALSSRKSLARQMRRGRR